MRSLLILLFIVPLFSCEDNAKLGFECTTGKCVFKLEIPQAAVAFVDVGLLESEIADLDVKVTQLADSGALINDEEAVFGQDFDALKTNLTVDVTSMFETITDLNSTSYGLLQSAENKKNDAVSLKASLDCMVNKGLPEKCGENAPTVPTTAPGVTTEAPTEKPCDDCTTVTDDGSATADPVTEKPSSAPEPTSDEASDSTEKKPETTTQGTDVVPSGEPDSGTCGNEACNAGETCISDSCCATPGKDGDGAGDNDCCIGVGSDCAEP